MVGLAARADIPRANTRLGVAYVSRLRDTAQSETLVAPYMSTSRVIPIKKEPKALF